MSPKPVVTGSAVRIVKAASSEWEGVGGGGARAAEVPESWCC